MTIPIVNGRFTLDGIEYFTHAIRVPQEGDWFLDNTLVPRVKSYDENQHYTKSRVILRRVVQWKVPEDKDARLRPTCRYKLIGDEHVHDLWYMGTLLAVVFTKYPFVIINRNKDIYVASICEIES